MQKLFDAYRTKDETVFLNCIMRFGKTPTVLQFCNLSDIKTVAVIMNESHKSYSKLLSFTKFNEEVDIHFYNEGEL